MRRKRRESLVQLFMAVNVLKKYRIRLFFIFIVTFTLMLLVTYFRNNNRAVATISMNYSGIERGENPNGTRFSINMLVSDEVLSVALAKAGLDNQVSPEVLRSYLSIGSQTVSSSTENFYYSSSYSLTFKAGWEWGQYGVNASNMLNLIIDAYQEAFYKKYTVNYALLQQDMLLGDQDDLNDLRIQYKLRANQMNHYLEMRTNNGAQGYISGDQKTFATLQKRVNNFLDYIIANFETFIWEKGIIGSNSKLLQTLGYRNSMLEENRKLAYIDYEVKKGVIPEYDSAMSAVVLIPSEDQGQQYYMSRTRIGIDYLAEQAYDGLDLSEQTALKIAQNKDRMAKIRATEASSQSIAIATELSAAAAEELKSIQDEILELDKQYIQDTEKDFFRVSVKDMKLMDKIQKKLSFLVAFAMFLVVFVGLYLVELADKRGGVINAEY